MVNLMTEDLRDKVVASTTQLRSQLLEAVERLTRRLSDSSNVSLLTACRPGAKLLVVLARANTRSSRAALTLRLTHATSHINMKVIRI